MIEYCAAGSKLEQKNLEWGRLLLSSSNELDVEVASEEVKQ